MELLLRSVRRVERSFKVRRWALLSARVVLLAAFALAAARPRTGGDAGAVGAAGGPEDIAVVLDASLSMRARFDGQTAFQRALVHARGRVDGLTESSRMLLVAAEATPRALVDRATADRGELLGVLREAEPSYGTASLAEAIDEAVRLLEASKSEEGRTRRVIVLSDLARPAIDGAAEATMADDAPSLELVDVLADLPPASRSNTGLTEARAAVVPDAGPGVVEVTVRLRNHGLGPETPTEPRDLSLVCEGRDTPVAESFIEVSPGTIAHRTLQVNLAEAGLHRCRAQLANDALQEDDQRPFLVTIEKQIRTLVVDGAPSGVQREDEAYYLERAMAAGITDHPSPRIVTEDELSRIDLAQFEVVVLAGVPRLAPNDADRLVGFVEGGGGLLLTAGADFDLAGLERGLGKILPGRIGPPKSRPEGRPALLSTTQLEHPLLSVFDAESISGLTSARTQVAASFEPDSPTGWTAVLDFDDGAPALVTGSAGRGRVGLLLTTIDRDWTDLPIRPGFVPLVRQMVLWLGSGLQSAHPSVFRVGTPAIVPVPPGTRSVEVRTPSGRSQTLTPSPSETTLSFRGTTEPGHYAVRIRDEQGRWSSPPRASFVAVTDPLESDLRPVPPEEALAVLRGETAPTQLGQGELVRGPARSWGVQGFAGWLLVLVLLAFVMESVISGTRAGR